MAAFKFDPPVVERNLIIIMTTSEAVALAELLAKKPADLYDFFAGLREALIHGGAKGVF